YERPTTRFGADFIGEMNFLTAKIAGQNAETVTLELLGTRVAVPCVDAVPPPGSQVALAIRPEALEFAGSGSSPAPGYVSLRGTIAEEIYIGTDRRYVVALADGSRVVVRSQNRSGERRR